MRTSPVLRLSAFAALVALAGAAQAQFSSPVRNVENPDRFPYMERGSTTIQTNVVNGFMLFPTPAGKRYIIEYVSVTCSTPSASDTFPQVILSVTRAVSSNTVQFVSFHPVAMERRGPGPFSGWVHTGGANVKAYSDPSPFEPGGGNGISLNIFHTDFTQQATCTGVVTGHTITP